jgi:hypothetical protein
MLDITDCLFETAPCVWYLEFYANFKVREAQSYDALTIQPDTVFIPLKIYIPLKEGPMLEGRYPLCCQVVA